MRATGLLYQVGALVDSRDYKVLEFSSKNKLLDFYISSNMIHLFIYFVIFIVVSSRRPLFATYFIHYEYIISDYFLTKRPQTCFYQIENSLTFFVFDQYLPWFFLHPTILFYEALICLLTSKRHIHDLTRNSL